MARRLGMREHDARWEKTSVAGAKGWLNSWRFVELALATDVQAPCVARHSSVSPNHSSPAVRDCLDNAVSVHGNSFNLTGVDASAQPATRRVGFSRIRKG